MILLNLESFRLFLDLKINFFAIDRRMAVKQKMYSRKELFTLSGL